MAGSYHAGKFLRPHGKSGKVYFPEDGTAYFRTTASRYGAIKPIENHLLAGRDILRELTDDGSMQVNAWMVLLHNTLLGTEHPEAAVANAFGDRYVYALCPSHPDSRAYAIGQYHFAHYRQSLIAKEHVFGATQTDAFSAKLARNLRIARRGTLAAGKYADVVVFNADSIIDHATFEKPHQYATGVEFVTVNGTVVLDRGVHTGARPGAIVTRQ